ncbi:protein takeout-like [Schistocerca piceifrons]|uniref:protein takeout-like n=1 Tax=Schistocerca piceifrons TaxID=274613 RepID=UPI001F5FEB7C|nr:protein takeout-like [Schistocerca piceifrons]
MRTPAEAASAASALLVAACAVAAAAAPNELPSTFKLCHRSQPDVAQCLTDAFQSAIPELKKGLPAFGVYSIDPLKVTQMLIDQGDGPVNIKLDFTDQTFTGFGDITVKDLKVNLDPDNFHIDAKVSIPNLDLKGKYQIDGKVLVLPIQGKGNSDLTLKDVICDVVMTGEPVEKSGEKYVNIKDFKINFETSRLYLTFENLFNGDKALGDNMNNFINENWDVILKELKPGISDVLGAIFQDISNRIFSKVPYDKIFLP